MTDNEIGEGMTIEERPILFSAPMVRAILEGSKTQTRQLATMRVCGGKTIEVPADDDAQWVQRVADNRYGKPGDRLWVRETWQVVEGHEESESWEMPHIRWFEITGWPEKIPKCLPAEHHFRYAADEWVQDERAEMEEPYPWRPSTHMPRWASRILLEITSVRVERLQSITEEDARSEGIADGGCLNCGNPEPCGCVDPQPDARDAFAWLWQSLHGSESWHSNPWVWVVEFHRVEAQPESNE